MFRSLVLVLLVVGAGCLADAPRRELPRFPGREHDSADLKTWIAWILPGERDLAWTQIPWIPTLAEAVRRAGEERKPLLLWLMNGHPLGCT